MPTNKPLSAEELLPCPFCGEEAVCKDRRSIENAAGIGNGTYRAKLVEVFCTNAECGASLKGGKLAEKRIRASWNTRAQVQQAAMPVGDDGLPGHFYTRQYDMTDWYNDTDVKALAWFKEWQHSNHLFGHWPAQVRHILEKNTEAAHPAAQGKAEGEGKQ